MFSSDLIQSLCCHASFWLDDVTMALVFGLFARKNGVKILTP